MEVSLFRKAALKFLVGFAIFCALWAAIFLVALQLFPDHKDFIALGFVAGVFVSYIPWFLLTVRVTVQGEGQAVALRTIKDEIESINNFDVPVIVKQSSTNNYLLTWRFEDEKWYEVLAKSGMRKSYELVVKLDDAKKRATVVEIHKSIYWKRDLSSFRLAGGYFRGLSVGYSKGATWGIRESFADAQVHDYKHDYKFVTTEIREPVINTLLRNGWDVRFALI